MRTLKESLLNPIDKTLSDNTPYKKLYPVPKAKDFKKGVWGGVYIEWICGKLIQQYIDYLDIPEFGVVPKTAITGIRVDISKDYVIETSLISTKTMDSTGDTHYLYSKVDLAGVGDWIADNLPKSKKAALEFFNAILNNPDNLKKVFDWAMKCEKDLKSIGMCDCKTWNKIIGY